MLLRRITKHVKDQNWFAVGIDFAIVVLGVFIGLQVANWNEARSENEQIADQLSSFHTELILARDVLADRQAYYEDRIEGAAFLRRRLEQGDDLPAEEFNQLVLSATRGGALNIAFRGYEEITTTGAMSKVTDTELRELLHKWDTQLAFIRRSDLSVEYMRNSLIIPTVLNGTTFGNALRTDDRYPEVTETERFDFDIEAIRSNRSLDGALAIRHVHAKQQLNLLNDFIQTTEALIFALGEGVE